MLTPEPKMVGRFEEHSLPDGSVVYKEIRGDNHYYHAEVKKSKSAKGGYSFVKGSTLTGVSTASKHLDGDATGLMHWSARLNMAGVARIVSGDMDAGASLDWLRSQESIEARLRAEEATWEDERDRRADQGTNVHKETVWKLATGQEATLADVSDVERKFSQGVFASFRALGLRGKVKYAEQLTVAHDKRIAGTFDVFAEGIESASLQEHAVNPEAAPEAVKAGGVVDLLADYKTRDAAGKVRKSDYLQLRGYDDCNVSCGLGAAEALAVVIVLPDGSWELHWCEATASEWFASLTACHSGKQVDRRMAKAKREADKAREAVVA
jgi:hypothetical protein